MNHTIFCNKKSLIINSSNIKNDIKISIQKIGNFNLTSKYYTFLNKKNVNNLKETKFLVSLSTFGKKFILFMTTYNTKKYCIFINKKNESMIITQLKFNDEIFYGTLFDGELVKNTNNKWIFLINDIGYYKGESVITKLFDHRQQLIDNILKIDHDNDDINQTLYISKKIYFEYNNIKDLTENYIKNLNYKSSGLYFKNTKNFSDNYLFIFPECRSDSQILKDTNKEDENILFKNVENVSELKKQDIKPVSNIKLEKTTCKFLINKTNMPDIYELYCSNNNSNIEKHSYASVPDIDFSNLLKNITLYDDPNEDIINKFNNNKAIFVECNYHKNFKKWIPFKKVDSMDTITTINQIQIILDTL